MKTAKPSAAICEALDLMTIERRIETCGRICYKSEAKMTEESHRRFIMQVRDQGHNSVLEMAVVTLRVAVDDHHLIDLFHEVEHKYLVYDEIEDNVLLVTGSIRAFRDLVSVSVDDELVYAMVSYLSCAHDLCFADKLIDASAVSESIQVCKVSLQDLAALPMWLQARHRFVAVRFVVNRAVSHEIVRHRPCSFLQESQRYCRYDKAQFGGEVTFIEPMFFIPGSEEYDAWELAMKVTEAKYLALLETSTPQAARTVLPNSCKTEIIVFANLAEWRHIFKLRTSPACDPSMLEVMKPLLVDFVNRWPGVFPEWL